MSSRKKSRRRGAFVPPPDWIKAKTILVGDDFHVEFSDRAGKKCCLPIGLKQAWNWNVTLGMELYITVEKGQCTVRRRVHQNKQFVQIT